MYNFLKIIHVISASILLGSSIISSLLIFNLRKLEALERPRLRREIYRFNWIVLSLAGFWQLISGFSMIFLQSYHFTTEWIALVLLGYGVVAFAWLSIIYLQLKQTQVANGQQIYYRTRLAFGTLAYLSLGFIYYLMTHRPH
ncbi:MAG: DUF2269 domain-containing protein [Gammaproteobacteria bacterium]|nr:DUF2269 domain-containing protein [Gammaproteobacteria bacterium]